MGEIHIFCPIPLKGNKSKCRRLGKKHKNGILEGEKVSIESKAGVEKLKMDKSDLVTFMHGSVARR